MMIKRVKSGDRKEFDKQATHPMQSWAWGEFRRSNRVKVIRLGEYSRGKLTAGYQITFHQIPGLALRMGYCPKSRIPGRKMLEEIKKEAKGQKAVAVKFEPNARSGLGLDKKLGLVRGRPLFTKHTFWLDLNKTEKELLSGMKAKTRYNIKLAKRKGVRVIEDSSDEGFGDYWKLMKETTSRQAFYAHDRAYHWKMWREMRKAGQAYLFKAVYKNEVLAAWIVFILNGVLYYPYGASSRKHRELMANNLLAWEVIKFGKKEGCRLFDMWGSLGESPDKSDPWYGFHRFKKGYGGELVEFVGSWDLVVSPVLYWFYRVGEKVRWQILRILKRWRT